MGTRRNKQKRAALSVRREQYREDSQRREVERHEQNEQERRREHRAAQKREWHRTWRTRTRTSNDVMARTEIASGAGPSGGQNGEEQYSGEEDVLESPVQDQEVGIAAEETRGGGSEEENTNLTPDMDFTANEGDDSDHERVTPRNRKVRTSASRVVNYLMQVVDAGHTNEEKRLVLHRCFADDRIRALDPELSRAVLRMPTVATTTVQSLRGALQSIRGACIQGKSKVRNIVLTAAVSKADSQRMICKALGASRYLVRKAFQRRAEVDEIGENLWAGGDRKRRSDALSAEDQNAVCSWWETETTVSPNKRDVKRRRIGMKDHETHATHYLQVSQV
ncbi:hypothetical protein M758_4G220900 [Ceratodon purpureus]|nr:hypothetical protein M758_4G220900 [Ceratodon purpureus]KAG0620500.1 hypothetical protein M758_4G220900 [Ceratodon purpureus]KAG0620501.1 hypothetical protein M758_4G220900 [Ceratodon purpureus]